MQVRAERLLFAGLVLVMVATVAAILVSTSRTTDRAAIAQLTQVVERVGLEAGDEAAVFLNPAERLARLSAAFVEDAVVSDAAPEVFEQYLLDQLGDNRTLAGLFLGRPDGAFFYVSRNNEVPGAVYRTKRITVEGTSRSVELTYRDADGEIVQQDSDPSDDYDPRTRPWYVAAATADAAVWTEPYVFFTSKQPGVTVSHALHDDTGEVAGAFGVDTELRELSDILTRLEISENGGAYIVDAGGALVGLRGADVAGLDDGNELVRFTPAQLDDRAVRASFATLLLGEGLPVDAPRFATFEVDGHRWRALLEPFGDGRWDWTMVVYAPEEDFLGELRATQATNTRFALGIGTVATLIALAIGVGLRHPVRNLQRSANTDALTGLPNRRSVTDSARRAFDDAVIDERPIVVGLIDIDRFKAVNDNYGHGVGDEVLQAVANRMRRAMPETDVLARYGGEEFALLMPDTELSHAQDAAQRVRKAVNGAPINTSKGPIPITVSIGLAPVGPATGNTFKDVLQVADRALYRAKDLGRDRVEAASGGARRST